MQTQDITYSDGVAELRGYLVLDPSIRTPRPGVVIFPEAFGLNAHAREKADRLAAETGYAVLAADLHATQRSTGDLDEAMAWVTDLRQKPNGVSARTEAAFAALVARPEVDRTRVGAIGYCFGGSMALELARSGADVAGVVCFHGGLITRSERGSHAIKGQVLACVGADDPHITAEHRSMFEADMRDAKVNWQLSVYGGALHSFTNHEADKFGRPEFAAYHARADARSWAEMRMLFSDVFGDPGSGDARDAIAG